MSTLSVRLQQGSPAAVSLRTGVAFAVTVAVFYALCTFGTDFAPLINNVAFSWTGFIEALVVVSVWAFLSGTSFEWLRHRLGALRARLWSQPLGWRTTKNAALCPLRFKEKWKNGAKVIGGC